MSKSNLPNDHMGIVDDEPDIELDPRDFEDIDLSSFGVPSEQENQIEQSGDLTDFEPEYDQQPDNYGEQPENYGQAVDYGYEGQPEYSQPPEYSQQPEYWYNQQGGYEQQPVDVPEAKPKKVKQSKKPKKRDKMQGVNEQKPIDAPDEPKKDLVLYIIIDKKIPGLIGYMRSFGLNVTAIFDSVDEARGHLLMQAAPTRVVVVDTGSGKFMTTMIRNDIIDMLGVNGEDSLFTVFYSDSSLKSDAISTLGKEAKPIEWIRFTTTSVVVATMLSHHENYVYDQGTKMSEAVEDSSILGYKGQETPLAGPSDNIGAPIITPEQIYKNMVESDQPGIPGFELRL